MIVLIDAGHGKETPGKRSPVWDDGTQLFEYEFNRDVANRLYYKLKAKGVRAVKIVKTDHDTSLKRRVQMINVFAEMNPDVFLVSIHANAGGGTGWEVYTTKGETESDTIAKFLINSAKKHLPDFRIRTDWSDGDADKEEQFYILRKTVCPAVLTENLFMDTERDCRFIMSGRGRETIAQLHFDAIIEYINSKKQTA